MPSSSQVLPGVFLGEVEAVESVLYFLPASRVAVSVRLYLADVFGLYALDPEERCNELLAVDSEFYTLDARLAQLADEVFDRSKQVKNSEPAAEVSPAAALAS